MKITLSKDDLKLLIELAEFKEELDSMKIKKVNPIAKALPSIRKQVVPSKKGKGSYNRKKEKTSAKQI